MYAVKYTFPEGFMQVQSVELYQNISCPVCFVINKSKKNFCNHL